jgi:hypothetical protein
LQSQTNFASHTKSRGSGYLQFSFPSKIMSQITIQTQVQGIPPQLQERYDILITKRRTNTLTNEEYQELLELGDRIEAIDVKRIEYLSELAKLRQTSLTSLIQELQLQP